MSYLPTDPQACSCPATWQGLIPLYCPVHNPGSNWGSGWVTTINVGQPVPQPVQLSPEDIEKIAQRVAELLKAK